MAVGFILLCLQRANREGSIIKQDGVRVAHRVTVQYLIRKSRDLEVLVLARAIRLHIEHRVLVYGRKTVVFD